MRIFSKLVEIAEESLKKPFYRKILKYTYIGMEDRGNYKVAKEEIELSCGHKQFYYHTGLHWDVVKCETCEKEGKKFI
jgi:hypothetical protein